MNNNNDMMNIEEVANYLKMSERAIYEWVKNNKIPAFKLGNTWRFKKNEIDGWMESNRTGPNPSTFPYANPTPLTNNVMEEKLQIDEFKNQVLTKLELNKGTGRVSFEQFTKEFNKEVIKKGLKELEKQGLVLEETDINKTKFITRR
tara:strand:- start:4303 stop:4743 length:441 start_codon:yes stop_codon:yes gene_type:complete